MKNLLISLIVVLVRADWDMFRKVQASAHESDMTFLEQAQYLGYPCLHEIVATKDGFLLDVYRIPGPKGETLQEALTNVKELKRKPVLFSHGLLGTSHSWLANGPGKAWGMVVPETGLFDAWFVNLRGNHYSRAHKWLDPQSSTDFWNFSFPEYGTEDFPAAIKHILSDSFQTYDEVTLIAFSEGTTSGFYALSQKGTEAAAFLHEHVRLFIALGPVITLKYSSEQILKLMAEMDIFQDLLFSHNDLEAYGDFYTHPWVQHDDDWTAFEEDVMCSFWPEFCSFLISAIVDCDLDLVNFERMDIYFDNKSGSSTKNMSHLAQMLVSGKFQEFDYGKKNFEVYGQNSPPEVQIENVRIPIVMFVGTKDSLATLEDNKANAKRLIGLVEFQEYEADHVSLIMPKDPEFMNADLLRVLSFDYSNVKRIIDF